jgi:hypothetical protein
MVMPVSRARGGFKRKVQLSIFIRDYLAAQNASGHEIYIAYKSAVQQDPGTEFKRLAARRIRKSVTVLRRTKPKQRVKIDHDELSDLVDKWLPTYIAGGEGTVDGETLFFAPHSLKSRHCINYNGFMHYIYILRRLGLVEYTGQEVVAEGKGGSSTTEWHETHPAVILKAVAGGLGDPAWQNPWEAYHSL